MVCASEAIDGPVVWEVDDGKGILWRDFNITGDLDIDLIEEGVGILVSTELVTKVLGPRISARITHGDRNQGAFTAAHLSRDGVVDDGGGIAALDSLGHGRGVADKAEIGGRS